MGKLDQLARHDLVQAMHARNAVAQRDDRADLVDLDALLVVLNLLAKQLCYLIRLDLCHVFLLLDSYLISKFSAVAGEILCVHKPLLQLLKLARERSVINRRSDAHHRAAQQSSVLPVGRANPPASQLRHLRLKLGAVLRRSEDARS